MTIATNPDNFNTMTEEAVHHSNYELDKDNQTGRNQFRVLSGKVRHRNLHPLAGILPNILHRSLVYLELFDAHATAPAVTALLL